ncbi:Aluminum-activated malate transporter 10 [Linum perenne]
MHGHLRPHCQNQPKYTRRLFQASTAMEWRINVGDGSSKALVPETSFVRKVLGGVKEMIVSGIFLRIWRFFLKAWNLGVDDPRKVVHGIKLGMALSVVSVFYYMRPLNDGVGGNAMWAIMTVVVVFENTVGATIYKCLNRVFATSTAGFLALGVHWVANQFIPTIKARFDYGCLIFILTFSYVTVSGYRVEQLFDLAHQRMATIIIGTSLVIIVAMFICPIWAGQELHSLLLRNMDKLAGSLDGSMYLYFGEDEEDSEPDKQLANKSIGYKCVLTSKAAEEAFANFARWEPGHGIFSYRHPWKQYLKVGAALRSCAYCIEALNGCINSTNNQSPDSIKNHLKDSCLKVSSTSSKITREVAKSMETMTKSSATDLLTEEIRVSVQELHESLKSLPEETVPLMEVIQAATLASLLIEIASRIEGVVREMKELEKMCEFEDGELKKKPKQSENGGVSLREMETVKVLQRI